MALHYRPAEVADIPALMAIRNGVRENRLVSMVIGHDDYLAALTLDGRAWVCEDDGEVVGFVCGRPRHRDVWALFLLESHHRRGIGNALMEIVEAWMFEQGVEEIQLSTAPGTRAERLYQRRGWRSLGALPSGEVAYCLRR